MLKVYYCYAQEDENLRDQLTAHLAPLRRGGKLIIWHNALIQAGREWKPELEKQLKEADLILLLISADFIQSDYCYNLQLMPALKQYDAGNVEIIPILLRPLLWQETLVEQLPLILPTSKLPVTLWPNHDEAFTNIAAAIRDLIQSKLASKHLTSLDATETAPWKQLGETVLVTRCPQCGQPNRIGARFCTKDGTDLLAHQTIIMPKPVPSLKTKEEWLKEGQHFADQRLYADALAVYEQALLLDPRDATAYFYKGHVLYTVRYYAQALVAYEQATRFNPDAAAPYCYKGHALRHLQRYSEALVAYDHALQNGSPEISAAAANGKGRVWFERKQYREALEAYEQAIQFNPEDAESYVNKGNVCHALKQYDAALAAYEQALQIDRRYTAPYFYKGNVLFDLKRYQDALFAYEQALLLDPHYAAAYHGQGRVYQKLGLAEKARESLSKAADLSVYEL